MRAELKPLAHLKGLHGHFFFFLRGKEASTVSTLPGHGVTMTGLMQVFLKGHGKENVLNRWSRYRITGLHAVLNINLSNIFNKENE